MNAGATPMISLPRPSTDEDEENVPLPSPNRETNLDSKEQPAKALDPSNAAEDEQQYLTGIELLMAMSSLTFVAFLILLDVSIVATVSLWPIHSSFSG
jgi:hypothetical protein